MDEGLEIDLRTDLEVDAHVQRSLEGFRKDFRNLAFDILHILGSE